MSKLGKAPPCHPVAIGIVRDWMRDQLRPEGREGIYADDEAMLILAISEALNDPALRIIPSTKGTCGFEATAQGAIKIICARAAERTIQETQVSPQGETLVTEGKNGAVFPESCSSEPGQPRHRAEETTGRAPISPTQGSAASQTAASTQSATSGDAAFEAWHTQRFRMSRIQAAEAGLMVYRHDLEAAYYAGRASWPTSSACTPEGHAAAVEFLLELRALCRGADNPEVHKVPAYKVFGIAGDALRALNAPSKTTQPATSPTKEDQS